MANRAKIRRNGCNNQIKPDNARPNFPSTDEISGLAYLTLPPKLGTNKRMIIVKKKLPAPTFGLDLRRPLQLVMKLWEDAKAYIYINMFFWLWDFMYFDDESGYVSYTFLSLALSISVVVRKQYDDRVKIERSITAFIPRGAFSKKLKTIVRRSFNKQRRLLHYAQQYLLFSLIITLDTWFLKTTIWGDEEPPRSYLRFWVAIQPWLTLKIYALFKMRVLPDSVLLKTVPVRISTALW